MRTTLLDRKIILLLYAWSHPPKNGVKVVPVIQAGPLGQSLAPGQLPKIALDLMDHRVSPDRPAGHRVILKIT